MTSDYVVLRADENQARGIGQYAIDFLSDKWPDPDPAVWRMVERFHLDSIACAVSALACGANAPRVLARRGARICRAGGKTGGDLPRLVDPGVAREGRGRQ